VTTPKRKPLICESQHAQKFWDWINNRGGLAIWELQAMDSSRPKSMTTPALHESGQPMGAPHWVYGNAPAYVITDPAGVEVVRDVVVNRLPRKATSARIRAAQEKAGPMSYVERMDECIFIMAPDGPAVPLKQFIERGAK